MLSHAINPPLITNPTPGNMLSIEPDAQAPYAKCIPQATVKIPINPAIVTWLISNSISYKKLLTFSVATFQAPFASFLVY